MATKAWKNSCEEIRRKKASNKEIKLELNEKTGTTQPINRQTESLLYYIGKETTMTEEREIGLDNPTTDVADTDGCCELTFTCPNCGSHELLKSTNVEVVARVTDIGFELLDGKEKLDFNTEYNEEGFDIHHYDIEPYVSLEDLSVEYDTLIDRGDSYLLQCAECGFELPVEDDHELVCWLVETGNIGKKSE